MDCPPASASRSLFLERGGGFQRLMQQRFQKAAAMLVGLLQAGFEAVAERHQFVDFGDDAMLFGKWR